jgi:uncharacterized protein
MTTALERAPEGDPPGSPPTAPNRRRILVEVLIVFGLATLLCALFWQLRRVAAFFNRNLHAMIAAVFLYLPTALLMRRREDLTRYGLTVRPIGRGVSIFLLASIVIFPLFAIGLCTYYQVVCAAAAGRPGLVLGWIKRVLPVRLRLLCKGFVGSWSHARFRLPKDFGELLLAQLLVVALPEEYFFRGYMQTRLEEVWPSGRRVLGQPTGWALLVTSALFALGHLLVDFNGLRLAVFFPALVFGWMRQATGSILAGVLFHACSNCVSEVLHTFFF